MQTRQQLLRDPDTVTSISNLATSYWSQGQWNAAEVLQMQVMETRQRVLGEEHPATVASMDDLALTWKDQGRHSEANSFLEHCLQLRQTLLGPSHPHTLSALAAVEEWVGMDANRVN